MVIYIAYFVFFMVLAVEYELKPFKNNFFLVLSVLLLGLLAGLRGPEVSRDYETYQLNFDFIKDLSAERDGFMPLLEPGFTAIVMMFRVLFRYNYAVVIMLFFGIASVVLKALSIKQLSVNPYFVILFYYSHYFLLHEMTQIRIGFASAILFISLIYYIKENKKVYLILILLATLFHYSAIMYLLLLFFDSRYFNKYAYIIALAVSIILGVLKIPLLNYLGNFDLGNISSRLGTYAYFVKNGDAESINVFNTLNLINIAACLYFIIFIPKPKLLEDKPLSLFLKCNILSIFLLSFLSGVPSLAFRFSELFGLLSMFVLAALVRYLPFSKFNILITTLIASVIFYIMVFHLNLIKPYYITNLK